MRLLHATECAMVSGNGRKSQSPQQKMRPIQQGFAPMRFSKQGVAPRMDSQRGIVGLRKSMTVVDEDDQE